MSAARTELSAPALTFEEYLAEGETLLRYEIIDGIRIPMTNPTRRHQRISARLSRLLQNYEDAAGVGIFLPPPTDILIRRSPLRTRQPDALFISHGQLALNGAPTDPAPLVAAPELVVDVLSPNETARSQADKLRDYGSVGVRECWIIDSSRDTVTILRLTGGGSEVATVYASGETVRSEVFPGLALEVADIFPP